MWWGNSPLLAPPALERFQNRPHSHRGKKKGTTNSKHTLIAKSGAPPAWEGEGLMPAPCVLFWRTDGAPHSRTGSKSVQAMWKVAKLEHWTLWVQHILAENEGSFSWLMAGSKISISIWNVGWILHRVGLKTLVNICPQRSAVLKYLPAMWQETVHLLCFQSYRRSELTVSTTPPDLTLHSSRITHPLSQPPRGSGFKLPQHCLWFHHQAGYSTGA